MSWHVAHEQCNRCETVSYQQAINEGIKPDEAKKQAVQAGRIWSAIPVLDDVYEREIAGGATRDVALARAVPHGRHWSTA